MKYLHTIRKSLLLDYTSEFRETFKCVESIPEWTYRNLKLEYAINLWK